MILFQLEHRGIFAVKKQGEKRSDCKFQFLTGATAES